MIRLLTAFVLVTGLAFAQPVPSQTVRQVVNVSALRQMSVVGLATGQPIVTSGYYVANDGGGGTFVWNATSTTADDGGTVIAPNGVSTGRWLLQYPHGKANVRWFGAYGDGAHDDTAAIQSAVNLASTADYNVGTGGMTTVQGLQVYVPAGTYLITTVNMLRGVTIQGASIHSAIFLHSASTGNAFSFTNVGEYVSNVQDEIHFRDFAMYQNTHPGSGSAIYCSGTSSAARTIIDNVLINNFYNGVTLLNQIQSKLTNVEVNSYYGYGYHLTGTLSSFIGCYCTTGNGTGNAFEVDGGVYCSFYNCSADGSQGAAFYLSNDISCNIFGGAGEGDVYGIKVFQSYGCVVEGFFFNVGATAINIINLSAAYKCDFKNISYQGLGAGYGSGYAVAGSGTPNNVQNTLSFGHQLGFTSFATGWVQSPSGFSSIIVPDNMLFSKLSTYSMGPGLVAFNNNANAAGLPPSTTGVSLGYNYSGGNAEANVFFGGTSNSQYMLWSSWDGAAQHDWMKLTALGQLSLLAAIPSTTVGTGTLVVGGGAGVTGAVNAGWVTSSGNSNAAGFVPSAVGVSLGYNYSGGGGEGNVIFGGASTAQYMAFQRWSGSALSDKARIYGTGGVTIGGSADPGAGVLGVGSPTGSPSAGSINVATGVYLNGTAYTNPDYVLEKWATGKIVKYADKKGAAEYGGLRPLAAVEDAARNDLHLDGFGQSANNDIFSGSESLLARVEESYLYLFDHEHRLAAVESRPGVIELRIFEAIALLALMLGLRANLRGNRR
jgi:hypothetical protein